MGITTALGFDHVSKAYQRGTERVVALADVTLDVAGGQFVAIVGPSGSGKSTLLHLAGGLDAPDSGKITAGGVDVSAMSNADRSRWRRRNVGFVFQFFHLLPTLTAAENIGLPLVFDRAKDVDQRVGRLLDRLKIAQRASHLPSQLSGGEMQRVAIGRALAADPALVIADEPTGNLDSATGAEVLELLIECVAEGGATLVMATHDQVAAARADRVVHIRDGSLA